MLQIPAKELEQRVVKGIKKGKIDRNTNAL